MTDNLDKALTEWDAPYSTHDVGEAENIISMLRVELAGKESVIKSLHDDVAYLVRKWANT